MESIGQRSDFRLTQQQVNVFGHDHVSVHTQVKALAHALQALREQVVDFRAIEIGLATITTESYEVRQTGFVVSPQTTWHEFEPTMRGVDMSVIPD
jgi:hypothetical protein